jgi:hypothetical protein
MGTLSAYVRALGGVLRVTADFGDEVLIPDGPQFGDDLAEPRAPASRPRELTQHDLGAGSPGPKPASAPAGPLIPLDSKLDATEVHDRDLESCAPGGSLRN